MRRWQRDLPAVDDGPELRIIAAAPSGTLLEQLLATAVLTLMNDVRRLKQKVADLEGRERV
jgi:hypothetical protein